MSLMNVLRPRIKRTLFIFKVTEPNSGVMIVWTVVMVIICEWLYN